MLCIGCSAVEEAPRGEEIKRGCGKAPHPYPSRLGACGWLGCRGTVPLSSDGPQRWGNSVIRDSSEASARTTGAPDFPADLRRSGRHAFSAPVNLRDRNGEEFSAIDLSAEGVSLISSRPLGTGRTLDLAFLDGSMVVRGGIRNEREVMRARWRIGIQFLQPQPELLEVALSVIRGHR